MLVNICGISLRASYVDILQIGVARQVESGSVDGLGSFARAVTSGSPCHPQHISLSVYTKIYKIRGSQVMQARRMNRHPGSGIFSLCLFMVDIFSAMGR